MGEFINPADVPKVKFYTGDEAPCIGMGTFGSDRFTADQIAEAVDGAIKSGYRMFDCAAVSYTHLDVYKRQVHTNERIRKILIFSGAAKIMQIYEGEK